ncbi:MAG TPA: AAA family ATPase [Rickettsiales bacterium]|nr:AAA family ATPase [Rickettsiales bacterium]
MSIKITKLVLQNFRNFKEKKFTFLKNLVFFSGKNGVGKTNILEALSVFGKNPNLRGADFEEMIFLDYENNNKAKQFTIFCEIANHDLIEKIGISFDENKKKSIEINAESLNSKRLEELKNEMINFIWLTPKLELLLISGKYERRDYLDKIVSDIDLSHSKRVINYQKSLKERLLILQKPQNKNQEKWLEIVENKITELGVAIATARVDTVNFFNKAINSFESNFPKSKLEIVGDVEREIYNKSALQIEEFYKEKLQKNRDIDRENFKTNFGVHRSDFAAIFLDKNAPSSYSSTGEQKSIMIGITLARAKISSQYKNQPTILIFDEIISHLDEKKKFDLFDEIGKTNLQCFFSATSPNLISQEFLQKNLVEIIEI